MGGHFFSGPPCHSIFNDGLIGAHLSMFTTMFFSGSSPWQPGSGPTIPSRQVPLSALPPLWRSERPRAERHRSGVTWEIRWVPLDFSISVFGGSSHDGRKWVMTMVHGDRKSPIPGVIRLPNGRFMAYEWRFLGPSYLLSGMILQVFGV